MLEKTKENSLNMKIPPDFWKEFKEEEKFIPPSFHWLVQNITMVRPEDQTWGYRIAEIIHFRNAIEKTLNRVVVDNQNHEISDPSTFEKEMQDIINGVTYLKNLTPELSEKHQRNFLREITRDRIKKLLKHLTISAVIAILNPFLGVLYLMFNMEKNLKNQERSIWEKTRKILKKLEQQEAKQNIEKGKY